MIDMEYMNKKYDDDMIALSVICNHHMHNCSTTFNYNKVTTATGSNQLTQFQMRNAKCEM